MGLFSTEIHKEALLSPMQTVLGYAFTVPSQISTDEIQNQKKKFPSLLRKSEFVNSFS